MAFENWEQDIAALKAVLDDLESGRIKLRQGEEDIIANFTHRLRCLDDRQERRCQA